MEKPNKENYRGKSTRLQNWDYGWQGRYFITIIAHEREHYFGQVVGGKMVLSDIGEIAKTEWLKTPEIRPDMNLTLDEYVIMPNHFHGIIKIGKNSYNDFSGSNDAMHGVMTAACKMRVDFGWHSRFYDQLIRDKKSLYAIRKYITTNPENWGKDELYSI